MINKIDITSDGVNVYVTSAVNAAIAGKVILTILNLFLIFVYGFFISMIESDEVKKLIIPLILMFFLFIFIPWRYWFWNFFGKEKLIINIKTITTYHSYGIIETPMKTIPHNKLIVYYEYIRTIKDLEYGYIHFSSYSTETNLPEEIFRTTVLIPKSDIEKILGNIEFIYYIDNLSKTPFSAN